MEASQMEPKSKGKEALPRQASLDHLVEKIDSLLNNRQQYTFQTIWVFRK